MVKQKTNYSKMVVNVIESSKEAILEHKIKSEFDVRNCNQTLINFFPTKCKKSHLEIKKFLMKKMYRHEMVNKMTINAKEIIFLSDFYFHGVKIYQCSWKI